MNISRLCFHCGHSEPDKYWIELYNHLKTKYNIESCFITDGNLLCNYLIKNNLESYSLDSVAANSNELKILDFLKSIEYKDLNEITFTQTQFAGQHHAIEIQTKALKWLNAAIEIIPKIDKVDVFVDFAGDELGHNIFDIIAHAAHKRIIKYRESLFPDRLIFTENDFSYWQFMKKDINPEPEVVSYIDKYIEQYFEKKTVFWGSPKERDFKFKVNKNSILQNLYNPQKWKDVSKRFSRFLNKKLIEKYYDKIERIDDKKTIFYFPLHYPIDSQLVFRGRPFLNQIDFALNIANFLPYNSQLIVKEHPHARGAVPRKELKRLKTNGNIVVLHPWVNSHDVLDLSEHVIVINSTVALEALYKGKHVISFGKNYLKGHDLITEMDNFYDLYKLYRTNELKNNIQIDLKQFLINAYYNSYDTPSSLVIKRKVENIKGFSIAIVDYLKNNPSI